MKKAGKEPSKKTAKKVAPRKSAKKAAPRKRPRKPAKKSAKKSANKATKPRAVTSQETNPAVQAAPVAKRCKANQAAREAGCRRPAGGGRRAQHLLHHDRDRLSERRAAYRPRLRGDRDRCAGALSAARRQGRVLPDRNRRARPEDGADRGEPRTCRRSNSPTRNAAPVQGDGRASQRLVRPLHPHHRSREHHRSGQEIWKRMAANGDIYLDSYAGWYSVRDEAYYAEEETIVGEDNVRRGPQGTPVEWVEEKSYFFKLSAYQDRLLALYESQPDFIGPDSRTNEVVSFVKGGLKDLSISRTTFDWGVKVPDDPEHVMYVWVDALTNYITGVGFPDESDAELALLAGRPAHHRQGHHPLPRGVLAGVPDVGGHPRAEAGLCPRLPVQPRREDVEVGRQRRRSLQSRRSIRRRSGALLLPARGAVRAGRQLQSRSHRRAHQCRPRQRSRQSGAALAVDDRQAARRRAAGARRVQRQRQGDPGAGRRHAGGCRGPRWRPSRSISG